MSQNASDKPYPHFITDASLGLPGPPAQTPCLVSTVCQCQGPALTLTGTAGQQPFGVFVWPGPPLGAPWPS